MRSILIACVLLALPTLGSAQPSEEPRRAQALPAATTPPPVLTAAESALGLAVAKVCANEASLRTARPADCALIYQTARRHGDTPEEQLEWLTNHSSCVLGEHPPVELRGNCDWTRQLTRSNERPAAWEDAASWANHAARWAAMLLFCDRMAAGTRPRGGWPCRRDPDTWGGGMDMRRAVARGYTQVACRGTANTGWMYPAWNRTRTPNIEDTVTVLPEEAK